MLPRLPRLLLGQPRAQPQCLLSLCGPLTAASTLVSNFCKREGSTSTSTSSACSHGPGISQALLGRSHPISSCSSSNLGLAKHGASGGTFPTLGWQHAQQYLTGQVQYTAAMILRCMTTKAGSADAGIAAAEQAVDDKEDDSSGMLLVQLLRQAGWPLLHRCLRQYSGQMQWQFPSPLVRDMLHQSHEQPVSFAVITHGAKWCPEQYITSKQQRHELPSHDDVCANLEAFAAGGQCFGPYAAKLVCGQEGSRDKEAKCRLRSIKHGGELTKAASGRSLWKGASDLLLMHLQPALPKAKAKAARATPMTTRAPAGRGRGMQIYPGSLPCVPGRPVYLSSFRDQPYARVTVPPELVCSQLPDFAMHSKHSKHSSPSVDITLTVMQDTTAGVQTLIEDRTALLACWHSSYYVDLPDTLGGLTALAGRRVKQVCLTPDGHLTLHLATAATAAAAEDAPQSSAAVVNVPAAGSEAAAPTAADRQQGHSCSTAATEAAWMASANLPTDLRLAVTRDAAEMEVQLIKLLQALEQVLPASQQRELVWQAQQLFQGVQESGGPVQPMLQSRYYYLATAVESGRFDRVMQSLRSLLAHLTLRPATAAEEAQQSSAAAVEMAPGGMTSSSRSSTATVTESLALNGSTPSNISGSNSIVYKSDASPCSSSSDRDSVSDGGSKSSSSSGSMVSSNSTSSGGYDSNMLQVPDAADMADMEEQLTLLLQQDIKSLISQQELQLPELMMQHQQLFERLRNSNSPTLRQILKYKYQYLKVAVESGRVDWIVRSLRYVLNTH